MGAKRDAFHYEFEGPYLGPIGVILGLPAVCYLLVFACNSSGCLTLQPLQIPGFPEGMEFVTLDGIAVSIAWMALMIGLHLVLPGARIKGVKLSTGNQLTYKLNGARTWVACEES
eukprot:1181538-Prorocentrum_minimum.AAC.5